MIKRMTMMRMAIGIVRTKIKPRLDESYVGVKPDAV